WNSLLERYNSMCVIARLNAFHGYLYGWKEMNSKIADTLTDTRLHGPTVDRQISQIYGIVPFVALETFVETCQPKNLITIEKINGSINPASTMIMYMDKRVLILIDSMIAL